MKAPKTLLEAVRYFSDPQACLEFLVALRWPRGVKCPQCGSKKVTFLANAKLWKCRNAHAKQKFSVKNGISSYELHRCLGVTQKTAWFMLQRIRLAMQKGITGKFRGRVEADETYIGAKARYMHKDKRTGVGHAG